MLLEGYTYVKVLSVSRLKELLDELKPDDMIHANKITGDLCIYRAGEYIGVIRTRSDGEIDFWDEDD